MNKQVTIAELAEMLGEDYTTTNSLIKFLVKGGAVKEVGKRTVPGQRGKASVVYEVPNEIELVFWEENELKIPDGEYTVSPIKSIDDLIETKEVEESLVKTEE